MKAEREKIKEKERLLRSARNTLTGTGDNTIVRVVSPFTDAETGVRYEPGDVVVGWEAERVARYAEAGLVEMIAGPASPDPTPATPSGIDAGTSLRRPDGASASRLGPRETKPGVRPTSHDVGTAPMNLDGSRLGSKERD